MPNYANGKIYSIRSHSRPDLVYIGSTTRPLSERFTEHKCNGHLGKQIIDLGDAYIELVEEFKCENKEQLNRREGEIQRAMECVNQNIAGRTGKEWRKDNPDICKKYSDNWKHNNPEKYKEIQKKHYDTHKETCNKISKEYHQLHKVEISHRKKVYHESKKELKTCLCGSLYNYGIISKRHRHYRSIKHQDHIKLIYEKLGLG